MQRFDILDPSLDILKSRFLEASAGTGKTFAIEHLFARLVREAEMDSQEILAVTFTREAAHEMKTRIREKLDTDEDLPVYTIHGFCHKVLTEFAFEAKAPLQLSDPDQPDHFSEMERVVEDFLRTGSHEFSAEVSVLLRKYRYDFGQLKRKVVGAMEKGEGPASYALELPKLSLSSLAAYYYEEAPKYKYLNVEKYAPQLEKYATLAHPTELLLEKEWFFEKMYAENARKGATPNLPTPFEKLRNLLKVARDPDEILKRIAHECKKRWEVKAARLDCQSFDDLLHNMKKALDLPAFVGKVRAKYKAVIVDEFQDTDPVQWHIFKTLFLESHLLYLVGDPKQSIYAFRKADIYTYMEAGAALGKENKAYLDTNFRSSPQLIDALNALFTTDPSWIELPSLPGALHYHAVKAGRDENALAEPPIQGFVVEGVQGRERSWPTKQMEEEKLFPYIAKEIVRLHKTHQVPFSEMAVLIKDRYQGQRLQLHLSRWNIPASIKRTLSLAESRGFRLMQLVLEAMQSPSNEKKVRAVSIEENPFYTLHQHFLDEGFASTFSLFVKNHFKGDSALFIEFKQTAEVLMQEYGASLEELLHFMNELKEANPEEDERLKLRGVEGGDNVPIMTTFASKGLEFQVVFALGLAYRNPFQEDEEKRAEKMRQLYVAFTRPREKLYIPIALPMEGNSPLELFFKDWGDYTFPLESVESIPITPLEKGKGEEPDEEIPFVFDFPIQSLHSFTSLAKGKGHTLVAERFRLQDLTKRTPHTLPLGAETGTLIHAVFENLFEDLHLPLEQIVLETLNGTHLEGWEETVLDMAQAILEMPLEGGFSLGDLRPGDYMQEMEFLFPKEKNLLIKGFADLVFKRADTFYLLDWKTNWLGPSNDDYTDEKLNAAMEEHDYFLQAKLYSEALKRYVGRLCQEPRFGGAYYIFVRGKKGVYFEPS